jgi:hypothetical protein
MHQNYVSHMEPPGSGATPSSDRQTLAALGALVLAWVFAIPVFAIFSNSYPPLEEMSLSELIPALLSYPLTAAIAVAASVRLIFGLRLGPARVACVVLAGLFGSVAGPMLLMRDYAERA